MAEENKDTETGDNKKELTGADKVAAEQEAAAAAAATAVETKKKEEETKKKEPDTKLDTAGANEVEALLIEAGLVPADIAKIVSENSGVLSIAAHKALVEKHGDMVASLVAERLSGMHNSNVDAAKNRDTAVFNQVKEAFSGVTEQSGEATWNELAGWAKENIPDTDRAEINEMLAAGGMQSKFAIDFLVTKFKGSEGYTQAANLESGTNVVDDFGLAVLDKAGYDKELRKLLDDGHNYETSPEIQKLNQRRLKTLRRGK